MVKAGVTGEAV